MRRHLLSVIPLLVLGAACQDHSSGPTERGTSRVLLTDDPFPYYRVATVDLYVVSVSASLAPDTTASGGAFVTVATPDRRINLLALQGGVTDELGRVTLPSGAVKAVRLVIDTDSSSITLANGQVLTSTSTPGIDWQSSAGRPVLNALIQDQILVPDSGGQIVMVYDVGEAFIPPQVINPASTDSGFIFSPVLRAADGQRTGAISGTVVASGTGVPVANASLQLFLGKVGTPENTWPRFGTARTDSSGAFRFAFVTPSSHWATGVFAGSVYIVTADPPPGTGLTRTTVDSIVVTAG
ncbi:MAG TPA: DUF4382 domain-containing protein, partial [Gemmatimonadales bacterium]|nr:DUF4382 domain-containing protein [Gemmatimonadales bacterium]